MKKLPNLHGVAFSLAGLRGVEPLGRNPYILICNWLTIVAIIVAATTPHRPVDTARPLVTTIFIKSPPVSL